ncbi:MAG: ABC transporter ATP-binding protein [Clostridia bacterium]|nr:ABC transporter ATP-binding protein [Clostridia bacterium]
MKLIIQYLKPYKTRLAVLILLYVVISVSSLASPYLMKIIISNGIEQSNMTVIWQQGGAMLALALAALVCSLISVRINSFISSSFMCELRKDIFSKINSLSAAEFAAKGTSTLLTRTTEDVWMIQEMASNLIYIIVVIPLTFVGGVVMTFILDWTLGLAMLVVSPLLVWFVTIIGKRMFKLWQQADKDMDIQGKVMRERLSGIRVIRSFDKETEEHERVATATRDMAKSIIKSNVISGFINPVEQVTLNLVTVLVLYIGALKMINPASTMQADVVIASVNYVAVVMGGLMGVSFAIVFMPQILVSSGRIQEIFNMKSVENDDVQVEELDGSIKLDNISFAYPDSNRNSLSNINMDIKQGDVIGIIGGTGSGKTTLTKLLLEFYSPTAGSIYIGGKDISTLTTNTVRKNVAIALQKAMIFKGTIEYNVRIGNPNATQEELDNVCDIAQMKELLNSKEEGLAHELQQAGANISGGQKQRISIARTILKNSSIYIFDDCFSALDYLTESNLRRKLNRFLSGKTQIIVTQRAATAMRCDKIYVLNDGEIVGQGKHKDLLKSCSIYKEIFDSQLGGQIHE